MATIKDIVDVIYPDFPKDRIILPTSNKEMWYKYNSEARTMYVPHENMLRYSAIEVDKFTEAVRNFGKLENFAINETWNDLKLTYSNTASECICMLNFLGQCKMLAVDIETKHLGYNDNKVLSIGFAYSESEAISITCFTPPVLAVLQRLFYDDSIKFVWQNGKFDITRLKYLLGIEARVDEDTMLLHYVGINERQGTHDLKQMAKLYLQAPAWEDEKDRFRATWCRQNKIKLADFTFDLIPIDTLLPYMLRDCIATFRLSILFKKLARPECFPIYYKLIEASNVFRDIELAGIGIDIQHLSDLAESLCDELVLVEKKCNEVILHLWNPQQYVGDTGAKSIPTSFNLNSNQQLKWIIEKSIGRPILNTNEDTLNAIFEEYNNDFITVLQELRKLNKKIDTYITGIDRNICQDGRIRGTYKLHGTETGRLSCANPNMQNIPRDKTIKNIFRAREGYKYVQLDYSQAELRVLAVLSLDPEMLRIYRDGEDIHAYTAKKIFGENFTKEQRTLSKPVNFGVIYGLTATALAKDISVSVSEASKFIYTWYKTFPIAKKFINMKRSEPEKDIECITPFGRTRHFIITDKNLYHVKNEAINTPIQSIASDLTLFSVLSIHKYLTATQADAQIIATVHDSILLEVKDDDFLQTIAKQCKSIMENIPWDVWEESKVIPFVADIEVGYSWGELKEL